MAGSGHSATDARILSPSSPLAVPINIVTPSTQTGTVPIVKPGGASAIEIANAGAGSVFAFVVFEIVL